MFERPSKITFYYVIFRQNLQMQTSIYREGQEHNVLTVDKGTLPTTFIETTMTIRRNL